ncbi:MAG: DUF2344 domain-containing protein [Clostridia bacterium]|nr:DUF2344 domain-containing protein [Clostridia bacterium]
MMAVFEKSERLRHIGHLDIQRTMQRALRRSGLPVKYSQGFNPHILVTFASALSTGAIGRREIMDVTMAEDVTPEAFVSAMNGALPPDMQISCAKTMDDRHPSLTSMLYAAEFEIRIMDEDAAQRMIASLDSFMAQEQIITLRKSKSGMKEVDMKPLVYSVQGEGATLRAVLSQAEGSSCKPDMLVNALCAFLSMDTPRVIVTRSMLMGQDEGRMVPLETL